MTDIFNPVFKKEFHNQSICDKQKNFTRSPLILSASDWIHRTIVNILPPNLGVNDPDILENNILQFKQELRFAIHVNNHGIISIDLNNNDPVKLGSCLKEVLNEASRPIEGLILAVVPMKDKNSYQTQYTDPENDEIKSEDQWTVFRKFYEATDCNPRIEVALVMTSDLPTQEEINRWFGECVSLVIVPSYCFVNNAKNCPTLPVTHKQVLIQFMKTTACNICIEPRAQFQDHLIKTYLEYIRFIYNSFVVIMNDNSGYEDQLRFPLQPMHDDLDSSTYEVFERDPAKYSLYQSAIEAAIIDKVPEEHIDKKTLIVMLVGAGRGPLIRAILNAQARTKRKLKIIVVEKNQNAIVTLSSMIQYLWKSHDITLISKDMRFMELEEKADILVSELLGSFGDNELSPECLDGAQRHLKPDGISIPCDSVTFLRPLMSTRNYNLIREKPYTVRQEKRLYYPNDEINWLVYLRNVYYIDDTKELWRFDHPNKSEKIDNQRRTKLSFKSKVDCTLHGFAGYFTSKLYKNIEMSILPSSHTPGMGSWYPMLFFCSTKNLKADEEFTIEFSRHVDHPNKVWYEWKVNDGEIYNHNGTTHPLYL